MWYAFSIMGVMPRLILYLFFQSLAIAAYAQTPQKLVDNFRRSPLPQQPIAIKQNSDLEDDGLKGKIKKIEYLIVKHRPGERDGDRRLARIEEFNDSGNRVVTKYVRDGVVASAIFYGYIDGERVSKSEGSSGGMGSGWIDPRPRDQRFEYKRRYKYKDGKLSEEVLVSNDNAVWMTYRRIYTAQAMERLVFSENGKLNQRYMHHFDKKGNEIGFESFDVFKDPKKVTIRARYTYGAFDVAGNWTARTQAYATTPEGELFEPYETIFRIITYYQ